MPGGAVAEPALAAVGRGGIGPPAAEVDAAEEGGGHGRGGCEPDARPDGHSLPRRDPLALRYELVRVSGGPRHSPASVTRTGGDLKTRLRRP